MTHPPHPISVVLFDLDGTLLDTAPTLAFAIQKILSPHYTLHNIKDLPFIISSGLDAMIKHCIPSISADELNHYHPQILKKYEKHINYLTKPFPNTPYALSQLEQKGFVWGIVTNKSTHLTKILLQHYPWAQQAACLVCGDTLNKKKPDPSPLLHAMQLLNFPAKQCVYVGDHINDIKAGKAANMKTIIADFGYISPHINRRSWNANAIVSCPTQLPAVIQSL